MYNYKVFLIALSLVIITMVLGFTAINNIAIGICFLTWLTMPHLKLRFKQAILSPGFWGFAVLYILNILGILYSSNMESATSTLVLQIPVVIFPLILAGYSIKKDDFHYLLEIYIISCLIGSIIGFLGGFQIYLETGDSGFLYSDNIVQLINKQGIYYAIYINIAIIALCYLLIEKSKTYLPLWIYKLVLPLFFLEIFMLASRISLVALVVVAFLSLLLFIITTKKWVMGAFIFIGGVLLVTSFLFLFPKTINRFKSITQTEFTFDNRNPANHFNAENKVENWNGLTIRLAIWTICTDAIMENTFLGVGTGDFKDEILKKYKEYNFYYGLENRLNAHNQYLQVAVTFGLVGFILFIGGLLYLELSALFRHNYLFALGFIFILLAFITETMLNRNMGVILFSVMTSLFYFEKKD